MLFFAVECYQLSNCTKEVFLARRNGGRIKNGCSDRTDASVKL